MNERRPYADPYLAGAALGVVLLAAYAIAGRGLGASGAFATTAAGLTNAIAPSRAASKATDHGATGCCSNCSA
jgi:hypothetical protein